MCPANGLFSVGFFVPVLLKTKRNNAEYGFTGRTCRRTRPAHFTSYNTRGPLDVYCRRACSGVVHGRSIGFTGAPPVFNAAKLVAFPSRPLDNRRPIRFDGYRTVTDVPPHSPFFLIFPVRPPPNHNPSTAILRNGFSFRYFFPLLLFFRIYTLGRKFVFDGHNRCYDSILRP